ncbi:MAG: hypothetical protein WBC93_14800 [Sulfitobacter sp.]
MTQKTKASFGNIPENGHKTDQRIMPGPSETQLGAPEFGWLAKSDLSSLLSQFDPDPSKPLGAAARKIVV